MRFGLLALLVVATHAAEPVWTDKFVATFAPTAAAHGRMSPDGRHLAFSFREDDEIFVGIVDVDAAAVKVRQSVGFVQQTTVGPPSLTSHNSVTNLRWVSARRLIIETSRRGILAIDADGEKPTWLADTKDAVWSISRPAIAPPVGDPLLTSPLPSPPTIYPRPVRVVGTPTAEFAVIEAGGSTRLSTYEREIEVFRVEVASGKHARIFEESGSGQLLYDQQGQPRIWLSEAKETVRYLCRFEAAGKSSWKPLDERVSGGRTEFDVGSGGIFRPRSVPLGFDHNPDILYIASNVGRDTMGVYSLDLRTGQRTTLAIESAERDLVLPDALLAETTLVFDPFTQKLAGIRAAGARLKTVWTDAELANVQLQLEGKLPRHSLVVLDWDERRERFLVHAFSRTDPGAFMIFTKSDDRLRSVVPLGTGALSEERPIATPWTRRLKDGRVLAGTLTLPPTPRTGPIPTVIHLPSLWATASPNYRAEVTALGQMGFAVLEVNTRGTPGRGLAHWLAARENLDRMVAEDVLAALDQLAGDAGLDRENVAAFGIEFGGYLALRLAQLHPERIRAVVALDPVTNLLAWLKADASSSGLLKSEVANRRAFFGDDAKWLRAQSPDAHPDRLTKPLLLVALRRLPEEGIEPRKLRNAARSAGQKPAWIDQAARPSQPSSRARLFEEIEEFLVGELRR